MPFTEIKYQKLISTIEREELQIKGIRKDYRQMKIKPSPDFGILDPDPQNMLIHVSGSKGHINKKLPKNNFTLKTQI